MQWKQRSFASNNGNDSPQIVFIREKLEHVTTYEQILEETRSFTLMMKPAGDTKEKSSFQIGGCA